MMQIDFCVCEKLKKFSKMHIEKENDKKQHKSRVYALSGCVKS